jgi:drug/metabolite transporter (DMT)-like permease
LYTTGRWKLGLSFALLTAVMWGVLPIALKALLDRIDPYTLTWYRFLAAGALLGDFSSTAGGSPLCGPWAAAVGASSRSPSWV